MDSNLFTIPKWFRIAIQAVVVIAESDGSCSSSSIAQELKTHAAFLRRVMSQLLPANIVNAREGRSGGYRLARPAHHIKLSEVYLAVKQVNPSEKTDSLQENRQVQYILNQISDEFEAALLVILEQYTIASMLDEQESIIDHLV
ncbi:Rrf2 family transcriptional regulator [Shimazuella sp. AN120528]|uniref:RrF2 family transcriptional regulator n=1 Tax=Shimazuella soli TaxID=1892854 RepID=UPI001F0DA081|nr:Rrf2 family transcriptional regulator [Shimazuella soli]MCH5583736.1 Rrf2 family transcriptional regulator [Shimazuella soli]